MTTPIMVQELTKPDQDADRTSPNPSSNPRVRIRRAHRKSRTGCLECKRRHIRCDETRPTCNNCLDLERPCFFPQQPSQAAAAATTALPSALGGDDHSNTHVSSAVPSISLNGGKTSAWPPGNIFLPTLHQHAHANAQAHGDSPSSSTILSSNADSSSQRHDHPSFAPQHLILLHHLERDAANDITIFSDTACIVDVALRYMDQAPYLIYQLLALSALHLSVQDVANSTHYRRQATELQTRALASFTKHTEEPLLLVGDEDRQSIQRFLFAGFLSQHMFTETLTLKDPDENFHSVISKLIDVLNLSRGIKTVVTIKWDELLESELRPVLAEVYSAGRREEGQGECRPLETLMRSAADLSPASTEACRETIAELQGCFSLHRQMSPRTRSCSALVFAVKVPVAYLNILGQYRPEPLIILAFYGVLLHRCSSFWGLGNIGSHLVNIIATHLGVAWSDWMRWPLEMIGPGR